MLQRSVSRWAVPLVFLIYCANHSLAEAPSPVATLSIRSGDSILSHANYFLKLAGQENLAFQIDGLARSLIQDGQFAGIDMSRELGLTVHIPNGIGQQPYFIGYLPLKDRDSFLSTAAQMLGDVKPIADLYELTLPGGLHLFLKFHDREVAISLHAEVLKKHFAVPDFSRPFAGHDSRVLAATLNFDGVPGLVKQLLLGQVRLGIRDAESKAPGESPLEHQVRVQAIRTTHKAFEQLVKESGQLNLTLDVNQATRLVSVEMSLAGQPGSGLERDFDQFGSVQNTFGSISADHAAKFQFHLPVPAHIKESYLMLIEQELFSSLDRIEDVRIREQSLKFYELLRPTLERESAELMAGLYGPFEQNRYVALAGLRLEAGKELEKFLLKLLQQHSANSPAGIDFRHDSHAGCDIHRFTIPVPKLTELSANTLGRPDIYVAFHDKAVLIAVGEHGLPILKQSLEGLQTPKGSFKSPIQLELYLSRLTPLLAHTQPNLAKTIKSVFGKDESAGQVRIRLTGGDSLRVRLDFDARIVKLIAAINSLRISQDDGNERPSQLDP